jgi:two-component system LytT family sensor kinase
MTKEVSIKNINRKLRFFLSLGFAMFLGLANTIPFLIEDRISQVRELWLRLSVLVILGIVFWVGTIQFIWFLENRFSLADKKIAKPIIVHLLVFAGFVLVYSLWTTSMMYPLFPEMQARYSFLNVVLVRSFYELPFVMMAYSAILGVGVGLNYFQKFQERALRESQLEAQLAHSQLQTLKAQLQPHFLFNTLNGIVGLIRNNENQAAIEIIIELSELLRYVTENAGKELVELGEELGFTKLYLDLHQKRFSNRLSVEMKIAPETLPLKIPNLILQPLVENAIVHGISKSLATQTISIETEIIDHRLNIAIKNDGTKLPENWELKKGVGLTNTLARLEKTYQDDFSLEIKNLNENGVIASLNLPLEISELSSEKV